VAINAVLFRVLQAAKVEQAMHTQTKVLKLWSLDRESGESLSRAQSDLQHELAAQQVYHMMLYLPFVRPSSVVCIVCEYIG
jgi:hypothetical protein